MCYFRNILLIITLSIFVSNLSFAQYFGRNKPKYNNIKFQIEKSPRFDIYNYLQNKKKIYSFANWAEEWADQHSLVLKTNLAPNNPILLYNNHADFQQTNAISGNIGVGTGGVTELFKNRVIMPLAFSNEQTHHVLGHEMVHAFQYSLILNGDSTSMQSLQNLPLWMVEGMAEYMSKGSYDTYTAMWMRDAVLHDDVPSFRKLDDPKYFPYRYGQAFWSFMTAKYGDNVIAPLFKNTAIFGFEGALKIMFGMSEKEMSDEFISSLKKYYAPFTKGIKENIPGKEIINDDNAGRLNVSPNVSPDGKYIVFLSEKGIFSTDLYLANTTSGKIIRKLAASNKGGHIEEFNYIESAGTWNPNSKEFAFVVFTNGHNELLIKNVENRKKIKTINFNDVPALSNPAWSPDGKTIALIGMKDGQVDIYLYDIAKDQLTQLTNDDFSEMQPAWSADSKMITYATDELTFNPHRKNKWTFNIATLDLNKNEKKVFDIFTGADNLNPQFDDQGNIYFLSDRDGFRNIYRYQPYSDSLVQLTDIITGVTGITPYSPALSVSYKRDRMVYSYYENHNYKIKSVRPDNLPAKVVNPKDVNQLAGTLPHSNEISNTLVNNQIGRLSEVYPVQSSYSSEPYKAKIKLDMITGGTGIGVGTNLGYGRSTGFAGGIALLFSDVLGEHQIFSNLALSGQIYDFGGQIFYLNNTGRWSWGLGISHSPAYYSNLSDIRDTLVQDQNGFIYPALQYNIDLIRRFEDGINGMIQYPFNIAQRIEFGAGYSRYHYRYTVLKEYYYYDPANPYDINNGSLIGSVEEKSPYKLPGFNLFNLNTAYVGDNAQWGVASPMNGWRYRIGGEKYFGRYDFWTTLIDGRAYKFIKPVTFAARIYNYNRFAKSTNNNDLYPLFAIDPTLVRGFLKYSEQEFQDLMGINYSLTYGSKLAASNFEVRLPFTGPERLSLINSRFLLTELAWFFDSGIAFNTLEQFKNDLKINRPPLLLSTGISLRVNLFGSLILEPYFAKAINKGGKWNFGFNFIPGW